MIYTEITPNPSSLKFLTGRTLLHKGSVDFPDLASTDEAPIARKLFDFRFVDSISIDTSSITITKDPDFQWEEIIPLVKNFLKAYFAQDLPLFTSKFLEENRAQEENKPELTVYTEITPNPSSLKFVLNRELSRNTSHDFPDVASAKESPIALKLFEFDFVEGVFIGENFITISKRQGIDWDHIIPTVKDFIKSYFVQNLPLFSGKLAEENQTQEEIEDSAIVSEIKKLLASHVRPAVAADGGDIIYESFDEDDGILRLRLQGSCSGCPSSTITLKAGIEGLMTRMVPAVKSVEAV